MSSSLGYRNGGEITAPVRSKPLEVKTTIVQVEEDYPNAYCSVCGFKITCPVPQGFLMTALFFVGGLGLPLMFYYGDADYTTEWTPPFVIGLSALYAFLLLFLSSNMTMFYNTVLGLYTGIEVKVIDTALTYATADGTPDADIVWSAIGGGVVIVHLLPFYLVDSGLVVTTLAAIGLVVNTAILVYLDTTLILQAFTAGSAFLLSALCIVALHGEKPSLLSTLKDALMHGSCLACKPLTFKL